MADDKKGKMKVMNVAMSPDKLTASYVIATNVVFSKETKNTIISFIGGLPSADKNTPAQGVLLGSYLLDVGQLKHLANEFQRILKEIEE